MKSCPRAVETLLYCTNHIPSLSISGTNHLDHAKLAAAHAADQQAEPSPHADVRDVHNIKPSLKERLLSHEARADLALPKRGQMKPRAVLTPATLK
jgi:hypothetical protein